MFSRLSASQTIEKYEYVHFVTGLLLFLLSLKPYRNNENVLKIRQYGEILLWLTFLSKDNRPSLYTHTLTRFVVCTITKHLML